jgi:hypothetical protein
MSRQEIITEKNEDIDPFAGLLGVYRGFTPSDGSPSGIGEIEVTIDNSQLLTRVATGESIQFETISLKRYKLLPSQEIAEIFPNTYDLSLRIFTLDNIPELFFAFTQDDTPSLQISTQISELLGPTYLYSKTQVEKGLFERTLDQLQREFGTIPRL